MRLPKIVLASLIALLSSGCGLGAFQGAKLSPSTPLSGPSDPRWPLHGPAPQAFDMAITVLAPGGVRQAAIGATGAFVSDDPRFAGPYPCALMPNDATGRLVCHLPAGIPLGIGGPMTIQAPNALPWTGRANSMPNGCPCDPGQVGEVQLQPAAAPWTPTQIADTQGDLMIWAPEVGCAPEANIDCSSAHGLQAGWVWSLSIPRYNAAHREQLYQDALKYGWTHVAIQVSQPTADGGYHNLYPMSPADVAAYGPLMNTVADEIHAHHLLTKCAGPAPADPRAGLAEAPPATGFDVSKCDQVMDDWDNTGDKDCRINYLAQHFPHTPMYVELPSGAIHPSADACSTVIPGADNGGAWIRAAQQRAPQFVGVEYETDYPAGVAANLDYLTKAHAWFRDIQEENTESDTYWKFWGNAPDFNAAIVYNNALMAGAPWLHGYMSSATSHPPVVNPTKDGKFTGELDAAQTQAANAPDFRGWPQTATISKVTLGASGVSVDFDKKDGSNRWPDTCTGASCKEDDGRIDMGPLQYSLGLAINRGGVWYATAPIEFWYGLKESGGQIQDQTQTCPKQGFTGQVACQWFYDGRWGALEGVQPQPGETIGVFVIAGDARNNFNPVQERSDIVLLPLPATGVVATFTR